MEIEKQIENIKEQLLEKYRPDKIILEVERWRL